MARLRPNICQTSNRSPDAAIDHRNWFEHMGQIIITEVCRGILMLSLTFNASNVRVLLAFSATEWWLHDWNIIFQSAKSYEALCVVFIIVQIDSCGLVSGHSLFSDEFWYLSFVHIDIHNLNKSLLRWTQMEITQWIHTVAVRINEQAIDVSFSVSSRTSPFLWSPL